MKLFIKKTKLVTVTIKLEQQKFNLVQNELLLG